MKTTIFFIIALALAASSCGTLHSTTYIESKKSFVLGQGKHGSYSASIENVGEGDIEVLLTNENQAQTSLGVLRVGDKQNYYVENDKTVTFKNISPNDGAIKIRARGDMNISMGFRDNE